MATFPPPILFANDRGTLGMTTVFLGGAVQEILIEKISALDVGMVTLWGDVAGSGSDTLTQVAIGGLGYANPLVAMPGEIDPIPESGYTAFLNTITVGRWGAATSESWQHMIMSRPSVPTIESFAQYYADSWESAFMTAVAALPSSFATAIGTTGTPWTFDDELDMIASARETAGVLGSGRRIIKVVHPHHVTQLLESMRNEPLMGGRIERYEADLAKANDIVFEGLSVRTIQTTRVPTSGADYVGGAYLEGALGYAIGSTSSIRVANPQAAMYLPAFGMIMYWRSNGNIALTGIDVNAWFGVAAARADVFWQRKLLSSTS